MKGCDLSGASGRASHVTGDGGTEERGKNERRRVRRGCGSLKSPFMLNLGFHGGCVIYMQMKQKEISSAHLESSTFLMHYASSANNRQQRCRSAECSRVVCRPDVATSTVLVVLCLPFVFLQRKGKVIPISE